MISVAKLEPNFADVPRISMSARQQSASRETQWLGGGQRYVVCAFYTPSYADKVARLEASLQRLGINHHLRMVDRRSTWEATTRLKAAFVGDCLDRFPDRDILYLDADAIVRQEPTFVETVESDVAVLFTPVARDGKRALSIAAGTLLVRNTPGGRRFAEAWRRAEPKVGALGLDEDMIYAAFAELDDVSFAALPRSYSKVFDSVGPEPVIEHFQASRHQLRIGKYLLRGRRALSIGAVAGAFVFAALLLNRFIG